MNTYKVVCKWFGSRGSVYEDYLVSALSDAEAKEKVQKHIEDKGQWNNLSIDAYLLDLSEPYQIL